MSEQMLHSKKTVIFGDEIGIRSSVGVIGKEHLCGIVIPELKWREVSNRLGHMLSDYGVPIMIQPNDKNTHKFKTFYNSLQQTRPDFYLVNSYTMILPPSILSIPKNGAINVHCGLLPRWRGGHIINWVLAEGAEKAGVTIHFMDKGIDTGDIIAQKTTPICYEDDALTLRDRLLHFATELLEEYWPKITSGTASAFPQDNSEAKYYRKRKPEDGLIHWEFPNTAIRNLVRALVKPWPGAFTYLDRKKIILRSVDVYSASIKCIGLMPSGSWIAENQEIIVKCGSGFLKLLEIEDEYGATIRNHQNLFLSAKTQQLTVI